MLFLLILAYFYDYYVEYPIFVFVQILIEIFK